MFDFLDVNRMFGRFYAGDCTDVFLTDGQYGGYLVQFDPEAGTVTATYSASPRG